jgi:pantetheine-phosphate adenylyltransferase
MTFGVYAGSFDPLTNGHVWMIQRGNELFDRFIVLVGENPDKRYTFTTAQRLGFVADTFRNWSSIKVATIGNAYLADVAAAMGATHLLRGVRSAADFEYERGMRNVNGDRVPDLTTVLLCPPRDLCEVSSSMVKGLVGPEGWRELVSLYVPDASLAALEEMHK